MNLRIPSHVFWDAVRYFWEAREKQAQKQKSHGGKDMGGRSAVTGGYQMNGFAKTISELLVDMAEIPRECIHYQRRLELPGFFRPTKEWDIVVIVRGMLIAALELKSQVGPSFGNNFNNRVEEGLGTAVDLWKAYREKAFGPSPEPFLGYLFLLEDCPKSRTAVKTDEPNFPVFQEFHGASYAIRYKLYCKRLVLERLYTSSCFLMSDRKRANEQPNYTEPEEDLSADRFLRELLARAIAIRKT